MLSAGAMCLGQGELPAPRKKKKAAAFFSMALVALFGCNTVNPIKPISISACYLLPPRLGRLRLDPDAAATAATEGAV